MARTRGEIVIGRPVEDVFDFVADERNGYDPQLALAGVLAIAAIAAFYVLAMRRAGLESMVATDPRRRAMR